MFIVLSFLPSCAAACRYRALGEGRSPPFRTLPLQNICKDTVFSHKTCANIKYFLIKWKTMPANDNFHTLPPPCINMQKGKRKVHKNNSCRIAFQKCHFQLAKVPLSAPKSSPFGVQKWHFWKALRKLLTTNQLAKQPTFLPHCIKIQNAWRLETAQTCTKKDREEPRPSLSFIVPSLRQTAYLPWCSSETVSFLRPFARREANTRRPFFVAIRSRKPCLFTRRRLCG